MVSVTHLILSFAIVQNKFQQTNKTEIDHIIDNHIKFEFLYIFWGSGLLCGLRKFGHHFVLYVKAYYKEHILDIKWIHSTYFYSAFTKIIVLHHLLTSGQNFYLPNTEGPCLMRLLVLKKIRISQNSH